MNMTSYANADESTTAATATTNATSTVNEVKSSEETLAPLSAFKKMSTTAGADGGSEHTTSPAISNLNSSALIGNVLTDFCDDDGREKADTTPENIKKIDDIIERQTTSSTASSPSALASASASASASVSASISVSFSTGGGGATGSTSPHYGLDPSFVGLGAAIDESNVKCCLAKPPLCSEKDTLSKSGINKNNSSEIIETVNEGANNKNRLSGIYNEFKMMSNNKISDNKNEMETEIDGEDESSTSTATTTTKQSFAFTIDHFNDKDTDPAAQAARYKSMLERFQNRHRRGASMSKLEQNGESRELNSTPTTPITATAPQNNLRSTRSAVRGNELGTPSTETSEVPKVKLRPRERSTSRVRDASKRHSWSPRSSSTALELTMQQQQQQHNHHHQTAAPTTAASSVLTNSIQKKNLLSSSTKSKLPPPAVAKGSANSVANRTQLTPRSTAMQLALQKVDFLCAQPPLADLKQSNMEADAVSETGTYTLDGDNYTEEQKDLMNIDRGEGREGKCRDGQKLRPKDLNLSENATETKTMNNRANNVLEVNYYHESEQEPQQKLLKAANSASNLILGSHQSAGAYLDQIKSRVLRNLVGASGDGDSAGNSQHQKTMQDDDNLGCFTSVTTSGVLAKQRALDTHPKLTRRSSLSTSQIDSSEYVSNEMKLKNAGGKFAAGGFTDHQKAEYRLNVFTNQKDSKFAATRNLIATPPDTPTNPTNPELSDTAVLKTAQTKQDWIQEWARNARARSLANETNKQRHSAAQELMTRSYNCSDTGGDSLTDDSIYNQQRYADKLNKTLAERYRLIGNDLDYSSDPALSTLSQSQHEVTYKPPKSPSKIPSPLHSLGRTRSASRPRASLQQMLPADTGDIYLQKTAAAINNLQQSMSRKSSIKSPTHSASPRPNTSHSAVPSALYSPEECSPQHSLESPTIGYRRSPMHRRHLSHETNATRIARDALMTSSINEAQLQLLTSGEYLMKQMRLRKNSFDGGNLDQTPLKQYMAQQTSHGDATLSPLRRSSSFSTKIVGGQQQQQQLPVQQSQHPRQARPQFQNIYTPPAMRHQYALANASQAAAIKKSASSNNFRQIYSDYDDNLQYYINDEDEELGGEYYSSGDDEPRVQCNDDYYQNAVNVNAVGETVPLSNTRYNKALLMRIERSKQKVGSGGGNNSAAAAAASAGGGAGVGSGLKPSSAPAGKVHHAPAKAAVTGGAGLVACPNTPELPRRGVKSASRVPPSTARQSMPRDTSLSRLANQVPSSLASAKKQLLQTAYGAAVYNAATASVRDKSNQRVQPKYLDISKYKPAQSNNFLRKNDSKITLKPTNANAAEQMKRSPSSSSMALSRTDATRVSNRSVRSVASCMNSSTTSLGSNNPRATSAARRDASVNKQKEAEMAMWKRRSTYDPMKAAAEDKRKKGEAKRLAKQPIVNEDNTFESTTTRTALNYSQQSSLENEWALGESSEYGEEYTEQEENLQRQQQQV